MSSISSVKIEYLASFESGEVVDLARRVVIVGPNNSGRSTLLRALALPERQSPMRSKHRTPTAADIVRGSRVEVAYSLSGDELRQVLMSKCPEFRMKQPSPGVSERPDDFVSQAVAGATTAIVTSEQGFTC